MKVAIFYFSLTGNTKYVAEMIKKGIEESQNACDLFDIQKLDFKNFEHYDFWGFGAPVFAYREPEPMREFILNLPKLNKQVFLFCTCEGDAGNYFFRMSNNLLKKKGISVFALETIFGPSSFTMWRKKEQKDIFLQKEIDKASSFGKNLVLEYNTFIKGKKSIHKIKRNLKGAILGAFLSDWALNFYLGKIKVNTELCTKCEICATICPAKAIALDPFPIITKKKCTGCCGCINRCPANALDSKKTKDKARYQFSPSLIQ